MLEMKKNHILGFKKLTLGSSNLYLSIWVSWKVKGGRLQFNTVAEIHSEVKSI